MTELEEHARAALEHLLEKVNLREDLDLLTKDRIIDTILTVAPDAKVSDLIKVLTVKATEVKKETDAKAGLVKTLAMEGPNKFEDVYYIPVCKFGCEDCIYDPAYVYATYPYPDWSKTLYGGQTPE